MRIVAIALCALAVVGVLARTTPGAAGDGERRTQPLGRAPASTSERRPGPVPIVKQAFRNNCETAALSMLLASAGVRIDQLALQRQVAKSGPLDPIVTGGDSWIWGDPEQGFVGRAAGGGTAGGFGVYQTPIRLLARRHGVVLDDLTRKTVGAVVARLRAGRPVMAWIGLQQGPYRRWETPRGRDVVVNFGEHVVVLTGIRGSAIRVNDPLTGTRLEWSVAEFAKRWRWLGKRALAL